MTLERVWAGWRAAYVRGENSGVQTSDCVMCDLQSGDDEEMRIIARGEHVFAVLNIFPYTSGHLMIVPNRHVGEIEDLTAGEESELSAYTRRAVRAIKNGYSPQGINVGMNLGEAAGAGVPGHLHQHVLPRWNADSNFMTAVADARVLPEDFATTWTRLRENWPYD